MRFVKLPLLLALSALMLVAGELPRAAPDQTFTTPDGVKHKISDYKGKGLMVMFFSTTCPHCQNTAKLLGPIYQEYKAKGAEILGFAIDPTATSNLGTFKANQGVEFPLALSTRSAATEFGQISVMTNFYVPYIFFVDKEGNVIEEHEGRDRKFYANQEANIRASLDRALGLKKMSQAR